MNGVVAMPRPPTDYTGPERRAVDGRIVQLEERLFSQDEVWKIRHANLECRLKEQKAAIDRLYNGVWWAISALFVALLSGFGTILKVMLDQGKHLVN